MRNGRPAAASGDRTGPNKEGSITRIIFLGSFPNSDLPVPHLPEVAFVGRSNVGKSSLINALLGRKSVARISRTPGKTTMANVYQVDDAYHLVDLPGYGFARASKAARSRFGRLIKDYIMSRDTLSGVVWLLDIRREPSREDLAMAALLSKHERPVLIAITKSDKVNRGSRKLRLEAILNAVEVPEEQCVLTSATGKMGITHLRESISLLVRGGSPS